MKYKVGDKVLIKQWDNMEKEYKLDWAGDICTGSGWYFYRSMKHLCGDVIRIEQVFGSDFDYVYRIGSGKDTYYIVGDMIERKAEEMTKADLKDGMVCKTRDESTYIVLGENLRNMNNFLYINNYCENLSHSHNNEYDIVEIYSTTGHSFSSMLDIYGGTLVWKREESKEMTMAEIEEILGYPIKIVKE